MRRALPAALVALALTTGCEFNGVQNLPLPGGAGGGDAYHVTVVFDDVLDLVPQAAVRVDDVPVGSVERISLDDSGSKAEVRLRIKRGVQLPANAVATLRQTSLLGEKFVAVEAPTDEAPTGTLEDGATISVDRTNRYPEVEEVLEAFSALVNGGGIGELQTIAVELTAALQGREKDVRSLLTRLNTFTSTLNQRKQDIVRALDSLDRLTQSLAKQKQDIADALDAFTPAVASLADQQHDLTKLLSKLSDLGAVGTRVVRASRDDTLADLRALQPTLATLAGLKTELASALRHVDLLTQRVPKAVVGDYLNLKIELVLEPSTLGLVPTAPGARSTAAPVTRGAVSTITSKAPIRTLDGLLSGGLR